MPSGRDVVTTTWYAVMRMRLRMTRRRRSVVPARAVRGCRTVSARAAAGRDHGAVRRPGRIAIGRRGVRQPLNPMADRIHAVDLVVAIASRREGDRPTGRRTRRGVVVGGVDRVLASAPRVHHQPALITPVCIHQVDVAPVSGGRGRCGRQSRFPPETTRATRHWPAAASGSRQPRRREPSRPRTTRSAPGSSPPSHANRPPRRGGGSHQPR